MILEILIILSLVTSGALMLRIAGLTGWGLLPLGFLTGALLFTLTSYLLLISGVHSSPLLPLAISTLLPFITWLIFVVKKRVEINLRFTAISVFAVTCLVILLSSLEMVRINGDSLNFVIIGFLTYIGDPLEISSYAIRTRFSMVPVINSLGNFSGNYYLHAFAPLCSLTVLTVIAWILSEGFNRTLKKSTLVLYVALAISVLVTSHAFVFHSFHLHAHIIVAAYFVLASGSGWLLSLKLRQANVNDNALAILCCVGIAGLVFSRVEGFMYASLVSLPVILSPYINSHLKKIIVVTLGTSIIIQQLVRSQLLQGLDGAAYKEIMPLFVLGILIVTASHLLNAQLLNKRSKDVLWIAEGGLWLILLGLFVREPGLLLSSVKATLINVLINPSPWGYFAVSIGLILVATLVTNRFKSQEILRFPITTFIPGAFILAYMRDAAYRVSYSDSLNRMLIHIVPLVVLFIVISLASKSTRLDTMPKYVFANIAKPFKGMNGLIIVVAIAIAINFMQFPGIRDESGNRWAALRTVEDPDILNHESAKKYGSFYHHLSLFFYLGDIAPNSDLILTTTDPFVIRGGPVSLLKVPGKINNFYCTIDNAGILGSTPSDLDKYKVAEGGYWASAGQYRKRDIYPGIDWSIYMSEDYSGTLVFHESPDGSKWSFTDKALIHNKSLEVYECL